MRRASSRPGPLRPWHERERCAKLRSISGDCSNFAHSPIKVRGKTWPTTEHFFQAQKFENASDQEELRRANSPMLAARMGQDRKRKLRRDWESVKVAVMREALQAKFSQHEDLARLLQAIGDAKLVEPTEHDDSWGDGGDGSGSNMLGRLLLELRAAAR
ncbi:NADAR family protein [Corallococcus carmarthensis]|uniref:NADAR family protein n=1 Tax=Corallococcus carmarthensis TaxID=2316728 RepID=A0A3A8KR97_9BACT|nr:NADAR family protein [Corallococcus carmarthensis]RKH06791.1 NADAR family protein [Corallococcus carmarthensis]